MRVRLTRIKSSHNNLRTDSVEGYLLYGGVEVGRPICIEGIALDIDKKYRHLRTSPVERIEGDRVFTANSEYKLEYLTEEKS